MRCKERFGKTCVQLNGTLYRTKYPKCLGYVRRTAGNGTGRCMYVLCISAKKEGVLVSARNPSFCISALNGGGTSFALF